MNKPDPNARNKARAYKTQQTEPDTEPEAEPQAEPARPSIRSEQEYMDVVGRRIEEATRNGAFDNLRGKGKPLNLQRNPYVPEEMEMAYSIMQKNEIAPEWIGDRAELLRRIEAFRAQLREQVSAYESTKARAGDVVARAQAAQAWHQHLRAAEALIVELNRRIAIVNLKQPLIQLEIFKLRLDEELARAGFKAE